MRWALSMPRRWLWIGGLATGVLGLVVVAATLAHDGLFHHRTEAAITGPNGTQDSPAGGAASAMSHVSLSEAKIQTAGITVVAVEETAMNTELVLPATIEVNVDRRVDVRPRVMGIIREVKAQLGQTVQEGDVLTVLDSPDVGTARLDLQAKTLDLSLARLEANWASTVAENVAELIEMLQDDVPAKTLEERFTGRPLGSRRSELLISYSELEIARHEEEKQTDLLRRKLVGEHPAFVAVHTREATQAKFQAALEQVRYDALQQKRRADQLVLRSEAAVLDASHRLRILGAEAPATASGTESDDMTAFQMTAPFAGTITARSAVPSQRVETTDILFTLVDLSAVRVVAHVHESSMASLAPLKVGDPLTIFTTAYPDKRFSARTIYVGTEVNPQTRTVSLVAELPNPDGLLRPGMFGRILLEGTESEKALTVPAAAVVELEGKPIVFVPGQDDRTFVLRYVELGRESSDRHVITSGLKRGDRVVGSGAFIVKSELILQNEPDDE